MKERKGLEVGNMEDKFQQTSRSGEVFRIFYVIIRDELFAFTRGSVSGLTGDCTACDEDGSVRKPMQHKLRNRCLGGLTTGGTVVVIGFSVSIRS